MYICRGSKSVLLSMNCLRCKKNIAFCLDVFFSSHLASCCFFCFFLGLWCSVFSIYFLSKIILDSNQRRTKKPTRKATTASPRVCVLPSSMCHTILCHCPQSVFLVLLTTTQKVFLIFLTSNTQNPVSTQGRIWIVDTPRLSLLRITTTNNNPCVFCFFVIVLLYATHLPRFVKTQDIHHGLCFLLHRWAAKLNSQSSYKIHICTLHGWEHPLFFLP